MSHYSDVKKKEVIKREKNSSYWVILGEKDEVFQRYKPTTPKNKIKNLQECIHQRMMYLFTFIKKNRHFFYPYLPEISRWVGTLPTHLFP